MPFFSSPFPCRDSKRPDGIAVYGKMKQYFLFILKMESIIKDIFKLKVLVYFLQFLFFYILLKAAFLSIGNFLAFHGDPKVGERCFYLRCWKKQKRKGR